ncbi:group II intron maturase-specific domain-containing protein (plasmid) [Bradyrhizobium sp. Pa8]|uniref:group II intron maturase-specific domain-containing protein n=1 Tax=Bradyrhizobium sp. Pa8 TaxID=3386552 RepID=UPI00403F6947
MADAKSLASGIVRAIHTDVVLAVFVVKHRVRDITRRTRGTNLERIIKDLSPYLIGWRGYFGFCQTPRVLTNLEAWIRRRLRVYLWRQWQNGHKRFTELRRLGIAKFGASVAAGALANLRAPGGPARLAQPLL